MKNFKRYEIIPVVDEFMAAVVTRDNIESLAQWGKNRFPQYTWSYMIYDDPNEPSWVQFSDESWSHFAMEGYWLVLEESGQVDIISKREQHKYREVTE